MAQRAVPKAVVFDLDACLWYPEMYHLWGGGGSPFRTLANGNVADRSGTEVYLMGAAREVLNELDTSEEWAGTVVCVASSCDEPAWARECLSKIVVNAERKRVVADLISVGEIHKGNKAGHFRNIHSETGIDFEDMVFFDDQRGNCENVARLGVTCYYTPNAGVSAEAWATMKATFPSPGKVFECQ